MTLKLHIIICSTRPGRVGPYVATWFHELAIQQGQFEAILIDLAAFNLPVYDEPEHPVLQRYQHEHTKNWAASVDAADAYVFVTPEYNFGPPPSLLNALNYVYKEWNYKPAGIVSYGGVSGGLRSALLEKLTLTTFKMMPMYEAVAVQNVSSLVNENKRFMPNDHHISSAASLLNELQKWARALKTMRT
ncbi:NAD(P)H-dependent FMN reductase [Nitrosomonas aestuarii]|uniref:NAD(P)H-dependent FMN reductase n=1 Tax=Nitrosomonas aestuarii TaxID=52441 RepID=A0A1I3XFX4_9PROT|nr:NAD(P)H-dependent oxidoreductase [Nitrosomonas aestuarii]SFK18454.1 NAD(P)H-dependent FMN reductase [Nitrosomonas aestuarii]